MDTCSHQVTRSLDTSGSVHNTHTKKQARRKSLRQPHHPTHNHSMDEPLAAPRPCGHSARDPLSSAMQTQAYSSGEQLSHRSTTPRRQDDRRHKTRRKSQHPTTQQPNYYTTRTPHQLQLQLQGDTKKNQQPTNNKPPALRNHARAMRPNDHNPFTPPQDSGVSPPSDPT